MKADGVDSKDGADEPLQEIASAALDIAKTTSWVPKTAFGVLCGAITTLPTYVGASMAGLCRRCVSEHADPDINCNQMTFLAASVVGLVVLTSIVFPNGVAKRYEDKHNELIRLPHTWRAINSTLHDVVDNESGSVSLFISFNQFEQKLNVTNSSPYESNSVITVYPHWKDNESLQKRIANVYEFPWCEGGLSADYFRNLNYSPEYGVSGWEDLAHAAAI